MQLVTQFCWMITFFYDNKVFLARTKIGNFNEAYNFRRFACWWTAADLFSILGCLFTLKKLVQMKKDLVAAEVHGRFNGGEVAEVADRIARINKQIAFAQFRLVKFILNALVSGEFSGVWKYLFSKPIGPGTQGLFGMISGAMGVYEEMSIIYGYEHIIPLES